MKTYISDILPKIQKFSAKLDDLTLIVNQHWVLVENEMDQKNVYIFKSNNILLVSKNGQVERGSWEYLGNKSLLIEINGISKLFKHGFLDENVFALKVDGEDSYLLFANETKHDGELNTTQQVFEFLHHKYLINETNSTEFQIQKKAKSIKVNQPKVISEEQRIKKIKFSNDLVLLRKVMFYTFIVGGLIIILTNLF